MTPSLLFDCNGETAAQAASQALLRQGLRVVRSFDLHSALATHADCECPHHGTEQCTCQFVVLLVYGDPPTGQERAPVVVTAHSRDSQAEVQIVQDANRHPDFRLAEQVMSALFEAERDVRSVPILAGEVPAPAHESA
jgi:hypothetical protein